MVKKLKKQGGDSAAESKQLAGTVKESAQQIWLAGLGAFSKAQEEGGKVFEALVKEGVTLQRRTQSVAEGKLAEATNRMTSMATDLSSKASGQWDKLESIFEERVSRALKKLGVPTAREIDALTERVEELNRTVAALRGGAGATARAARPATRKAVAKRPAVKAAAKRTARKAGQ
ncbi:phasin family protein [Ramlibacter pallidus]|uniref:Phasin family protein n=1 Tax=Ramlibacter pallidus TaxID=2780087 RepID=A0ABR9RYF7_9BURK|nr:phasin family protein [Ramlibacter pallidus]MBE7366279.1 phasin family protein [Ramlibacter pallidus]